MAASSSERSAWARLRWPERLRARTIRARIYLTLAAIILITLAVTGAALFFVLGSYQQSIEQSRVREIAKAWGPELVLGGPGEPEARPDAGAVRDESAAERVDLGRR